MMLIFELKKLIPCLQGAFRGAWPITPPPFWSEKYEKSLQKRVFINIFVILGGVMAQTVANPVLSF